MIHINNTLKLLGFEDLEAEKVEIEDTPTELICYVKLKKQSLQCPYCNNITNRLHSYDEVVIEHKHFVGKRCIIHFYRRRTMCTLCSKTFLEPNPFAFYKKKISDETVFYVLNELKQNQSFTDVGIKAGISTTEVIRIFDKHVDMPREKLPRILGIDEFKNLSTGRGKYACILTSIDKSSVVDVLEDRTEVTLSRYFSVLDREERNNVKYFVSDMYDGYRTIHDIYFPHSIHIIDTFHFVRLFTDAFNRIRVRIMKSYSPTSSKYELMKTYWKTLMMPSYKLHKNISYYQRFERSMNQQELLNIILGTDDNLYHAYMIKEDFCCNYYKVKYEEAEVYLDKLIERLKSTGFPEYEEVARSLKKWKPQLINSFMRDENNKRITNAKTEGFNNSVKVIKRTSYGYANFKRFRNRILYILRDNSTFKI